MPRSSQVSRASSAGRSKGRSARVDPSGEISDRELEIISLVARGLRNREIGEHLAITEGTVKVHLHNVFTKLGVQTRLALVRLAEAKGWI